MRIMPRPERLQNMARIVYILWARQVKRFVRSWYRVLGSLAQPILYLISLGFGFGPIFRRSEGTNYLTFLSPGIIAMSIFFAATFSGTELLWERRFGVLKEAFVAPVPRSVFMFGRVVGSATVAFVQGVIVLCVCYLGGFRVYDSSRTPTAIAVMVLIAVLFTSFGISIACLMEDHTGFQFVMNFLILPASFLSGAFYPLSNLPRPLYLASRLDPLSYGVDGLRGSLAGISPSSALPEIWILGALTVAAFAITCVLFARIKL